MSAAEFETAQPTAEAPYKPRPCVAAMRLALPVLLALLAMEAPGDGTS